MLDFYDELTKLTDALENASIEYAVSGGVAMAVHGFIRACVDIDMMIEPQSLEAVTDIATRAGFTVTSNRVPDAEQTIPLDIMLVTPDLRAIWDERTRVEFDGRRMCVVSRAGLITLKRLHGRGQDLFDIERLEDEGDVSRPVTVRLKRLSQIRRLCLALGKAKPLKVEPRPRPV